MPKLNPADGRPPAQQIADVIAASLPDYPHGSLSPTRLQLAMHFEVDPEVIDAALHQHQANIRRQVTD
ncbi:hypothetical protein [Umezawaea sp. NPDC059074]|uniref:hypothetical protein n=1 Tax=Umezawaea sp. NPDC059074 TaxID=3346716 RepID=UPI0036773EDA